MNICTPGLLAATVLQASTCLGDVQVQHPEDEVAEENTSDRFHVGIDLSLTNQYFFRGIIQETDGLIFQPSIELGFDLVEKEDLSVGFYVGMWSSFHDERTGSSDPDDFVSTWYEVDLYTGLAVSKGRLSADLVYTNYASPNDAFGHIDEISLTLGWDDSGWIENYTFSPYATIAFEIGSAQADGGTERGTFLAVGVEPSRDFDADSLGTITVSVPIEAGFSLDDYYEGAAGDESFGYFTAGLALSIPVPSPAGFGDWVWSIGADYLLLGDSNEALNAMDDDEWIVHTGMSFSF